MIPPGILDLIEEHTIGSAKVQGWSTEELLRTLGEAEIAARDESNARARLRTAGLAEFNVGLSSAPQASWDYLASLERIRATPIGNPMRCPQIHVQVPLLEGKAALKAGRALPAETTISNRTNARFLAALAGRS